MDSSNELSHISDTKFPEKFSKKRPIGYDLVLLILKEGFQLIEGKISPITLPPLEYKPESIAVESVIVFMNVTLCALQKPTRCSVKEAANFKLQVGKKICSKIEF